MFIKIFFEHVPFPSLLSLLISLCAQQSHFSEEECYNITKNNCIHVFTTALKYVRQIGSPGKGPGELSDIEDISSDKHGNLYVSDHLNFRIQVLSNNGEYLHLFGENNLVEYV